MTYEALGEINQLIQSKSDGKKPRKSRFISLLKIVAETGHLSYNEESLYRAVDLLFNDYKRYMKEYAGKEHWPYKVDLSYLDKFLSQAGKEKGLKTTSDDVVKRIFSRLG